MNAPAAGYQARPDEVSPGFKAAPPSAPEAAPPGNRRPFGGAAPLSGSDKLRSAEGPKGRGSFRRVSGRSADGPSKGECPPESASRQRLRVGA